MIFPLRPQFFGEMFQPAMLDCWRIHVNLPYLGGMNWMNIHWPAALWACHLEGELVLRSMWSPWSPLGGPWIIFLHPGHRSVQNGPPKSSNIGTLWHCWYWYGSKCIMKWWYCTKHAQFLEPWLGEPQWYFPPGPTSAIRLQGAIALCGVSDLRGGVAKFDRKDGDARCRLHEWWLISVEFLGFCLLKSGQKTWVSERSRELAGPPNLLGGSSHFVTWYTLFGHNATCW